MAPQNTLSYHVNGVVAPQANVGSAGAFVTLGVCRDGCDFDITPLGHGIKFDGAGGPEGHYGEYIALNAFVRIRFSLVPYAGNYVNKLRAAAMGSSVDGVLPAPGTLLGAGGFLPALYIPYGGAAEVDGPWYFPTTRVVKPGSPPVKVTESVIDFEIEAFIYINPALIISVSGQTLYTRTAPP